jgi:hypothetical protein
MKLLSEVEMNYKYFNQPRLRFELALLQIIKMSKTIEIDTLLKEFEAFKKKISDLNLEQNAHEIKSIASSSRLQAPVLKNISSSEVSPKTIGKLEKGGSTFSKFQPKNIQENKSGESSGETDGSPAITLEAISQKWENLLDEIMKFNKINLRSILLTADLTSFENNTLTFVCSSELNANIINNSKVFLQERLEAVYNTRFNLNPVCPEGSQNQNGMNGSISKQQTPKNPQNGNSVEKDHPIVQALMREFGAEPII